jgi:chemotaxis protein histidine kinase CheA
MLDPISQLHARYRQSFPDKRRELNAAFQSWRLQPQARSAIAALYLLTHKLAGSAGAYGCDTLADIARIADRLLQPLTRADVVVLHEHVAAIDDAVQNVLTALHTD